MARRDDPCTVAAMRADVTGVVTAGAVTVTSGARTGANGTRLRPPPKPALRPLVTGGFAFVTHPMRRAR
ncbi:hypothetical protein GCM10009126_12150 [Rhodanobacter caeni]|uniref:Uncharacterized protein n=2 Tax=Rhodanobacter caeni TaxID=657654 RepID=A0ABN0UES8_9GAMM